MVVVLLVLALVVLTFIVADLAQRTRPTLRVYPLVGRFPTGPWQLPRPSVGEQYPVPFRGDDAQRIRHRALAGESAASFGSVRPSPSAARGVKVALFPARTVDMGGGLCGRPGNSGSLELPVVNFGALGFGPVSGATIEAFGAAARIVGCLQNTGEEGISSHHRAGGARLIWQIGTGYAGCNAGDGSFSAAEFVRTLRSAGTVEAIEIKLSQGAKPGMGGFLPGAKVNRSLAGAFGVAVGQDIVSPSRHTSFDDLPGLLTFVERVRHLSEGLPIGLKLCVGSRASADELARAIAMYGSSPDFITVDGAEGGTGFAPLVLQQHAGLPVRPAVAALETALTSYGVRADIKIIAAGAVRNGFDVLELMAAGADSCYVVRSAMIAMGCIQARECHTGKCPSGIATQEFWRRRAVTAEVQGRQIANFYHSILEDVAHLMRAAGVARISDFGLEHLTHSPDAETRDRNSEGKL